MIIPKSKYFLGVFGEKLVHETLPESKWMRAALGGGRIPYDIEWQGSKIEVKTTVRLYRLKNEDFKVQISPINSEADVFVVLAFSPENKLYVWVKSPKEFNTAIIAYGKDAFSDIKMLSDEITKAKSRTNSDLDFLNHKIVI